MSDSPLFEILDFRGILQFQTLTRRMQVYSSLNILYCDLSLVGSSVLFFFFCSTWVGTEQGRKDPFGKCGAAIAFKLSITEREVPGVFENS